MATAACVWGTTALEQGTMIMNQPVCRDIVSNCITLSVYAVGVLCATARADFSGPWAPENWSFNNNGGSGTGSLTTTQMVVVGNNNLVPSIDTEFSIKVPFATDIQFDWKIIIEDEACFDWAYWSLNGSKALIACNNSPVKEGSVILPNGALPGQKLALGVASTDGFAGPMTLIITNFTPEPSTALSLLLGTAFLYRRR